MEIDVKKQDENSMVFIIRDAEVPFVNAIRRIAMMKVPKLAIEDVYISKNDSAMFDEVLAHRLGLTPLVSDAEAIDGLMTEEECKASGMHDDSQGYCKNCGVSFTLVESGPTSGDSDAKKVVYTSDLSCSDSRIKPVYDTIPLLELRRNEEVELEAIAKLGIGKEHAKWMPTTVCVYKQYPEITFNENEDIPYAAADACPKGVLVANKEEEKIEITDVENCSLCKSCVRKAKELGSRYIKIGYRENDFIFNIETDGSMPPKEVLLRACDVLNSKTDEFIDFSKGGSE